MKVLLNHVVKFALLISSSSSPRAARQRSEFVMVGDFSSALGLASMVVVETIAQASVGRGMHSLFTGCVQSVEDFRQVPSAGLTIDRPR